MSSQPVPCVTPEEYLKFDRSSEFRHEYVFGEIVQMVGGTYEHGVIQANAIGVLRDHLSKGPCRVLAQPSQLEGFAGGKPFRISEGYPKVFTTGKGRRPILA